MPSASLDKPRSVRPSSGRWSKASTSLDPMLGAHSLFLCSKVQSRILIEPNLSNRQDAHEALNIASMGKIHCHYVSKPLSALSEYVPSYCPHMYCIADLFQGLRRYAAGEGCRTRCFENGLNMMNSVKGNHLVEAPNLYYCGGQIPLVTYFSSTTRVVSWGLYFKT